jgi:copper chaperone CopZ
VVKEALLELEGVESVEDEWERGLESDQDLDLLFVTYDPDKITLPQLMKKIEEHGFVGKVKK